ncbi:hypothetical protein WDU94_009046 [Cyamophila willieti]
MSAQTKTDFSTRGPPLGLKLVQKILPNTSTVKKNIWYRGVVLLLTFWAYVNYHATRKTLSVVKNTLMSQNCSDISFGGTPQQCAWEPFGKTAIFAFSFPCQFFHLSLQQFVCSFFSSLSSSFN